MIPFERYMEKEFFLAKHILKKQFQCFLEKHVLKKIIKLGECMVQWFKSGKKYTPYKSIQDFLK